MGSKKVDAADVARAASQILQISKRLSFVLVLRYVRMTAVAPFPPRTAQTNLYNVKLNGPGDKGLLLTLCKHLNRSPSTARLDQVHAIAKSSEYSPPKVLSGIYHLLEDGQMLGHRRLLDFVFV